MRTVTTLWELRLAIEDILLEADDGGDLGVFEPINLILDVAENDGNGCAVLAASGWNGGGRVPDDDAHLIAVGLQGSMLPQRGALIGWRFGDAEYVDELEECADMVRPGSGTTA